MLDTCTSAVSSYSVYSTVYSASPSTSQISASYHSPSSYFASTSSPWAYLVTPAYDRGRGAARFTFFSFTALVASPLPADGLAGASNLTGTISDDMRFTLLSPRGTLDSPMPASIVLRSFLPATRSREIANAPPPTVPTPSSAKRAENSIDETSGRPGDPPLEKERIHT